MASVLELILRSKKEGTGAKDTSKDLLGLEKLAKKVTVAFLAMGAAKIIKSSTLLAARTETLGVVTKKLGETVGLTHDEIRALERSIVDQGITVQKSRQAIAMMIQANVDLAHSTDLARLAQDTAVIANLNSSESFQQLIYVLQTGNVRMARTLGLNVQFGKAQQELAKELGKTTEELSEQEVMQARTNAVMKAGARIAGVYDEAMGTVGKTLLSMPRQIEALQETLGTMFLPALEAVVNELYEGTSALNTFWRAMGDLEDRGIRAQDLLDNFGVRTLARFGIVTDETRERILNLAAELAAMPITEVDGRFRTLTRTMEEAAEVAPELEEKLQLTLDINILRGLTALDTMSAKLLAWSREAQAKLRLQVHIETTLEAVAAGGKGLTELAMGGPVRAGQPYIVGEHEAELFVPDQSGHVYNQNQLAGGDININNGLTQRAFNNMAEDFFRGIGG